MKNARNSEETLRKEAIERTDISHLKDTPNINSGEAAAGTVYQVQSTGAVVSLNSAVGLIHFYCSQLPSDRYLSFQIFLYTGHCNLVSGLKITFIYMQVFNSSSGVYYGAS